MTNHQLLDHSIRLGLPLVGIFNKDKLPKERKEGFYVINLQDDYDEHGNDLDGTHWTVFLIERNKCAYFDSFGFNPPAQVQLFLKPFLPYPYAKKQIQNPRSEVCGYYVLYWMWFMTRHKNIPIEKRLDKFMDLWSDDHTQNKKLLERYIKPL